MTSSEPNTSFLNTPELNTALLGSFSETFLGNDGDHWFAGLFPTLEPFSAAQVSSPVHGNSIAAHLEHVYYTLEMGLLWLQDEKPSPNWAQSWTHQTVDEATWQTLKIRLRQHYQAITDWLETSSDPSSRKITLLCDLSAHTAYHVGAIRQMIKAIP